MTSSPLRRNSALKVVAAASSCAAAVKGGLTEREIRVLLELRRVRDELRACPPAFRRSLEDRLDLLRREREEARRERMVLLGHTG